MARLDNHDTTQSAPEAPQWPPERAYQGRMPRERSTRSSVGMALVVIGLIWLAVSIVPGMPLFGIPGGQETVADQRVSGRHLMLDAGSADVEITRAGDDQIHVVLVQRGGDQNDADVDIVQQGDTVDVSHTLQPCLVFCFRSLTYRIAMPAGTSAEVHSVNGDIQVRDLDGGLTVRTTSGDVELRHLSGQLQVESVSGDVALESGAVAGADVRTVSGDIDLHGVSQKLAVETASGDIDVEGDANTLTLGSASGDIAYRGSLAGESASSLNTISGDVSITLAQQSSFVLDASTVSGDLANQFELSGATLAPKAVHGRAGAGNATLTVRTTSGDIELRAK